MECCSRYWVAAKNWTLMASMLRLRNEPAVAALVAVVARKTMTVAEPQGQVESAVLAPWILVNGANAEDCWTKTNSKWVTGLDATVLVCLPAVLLHDIPPQESCRHSSLLREAKYFCCHTLIKTLSLRPSLLRPLSLLGLSLPASPLRSVLLPLL